MAISNKTLTKVALGVGLGLAANAYAISPPANQLLPPARTANLYALEVDCDCVLQITPKKEVSVKISRQDILDVLNEDNVVYDDIDFDNKAIVALPDGSIIFGLEANIDYNQVEENENNIAEFILKLDKYGDLSILVDTDDAMQVNDGEFPDFEGLVMGIDGKLYVGEDGSDDVLKVDPDTGDVYRFAKKEAFEALGDGFIFDIQPAISADERYIYLASDDTPNVVYRIPYLYGAGKPEIYASGPGVDPHALSKDNTLFIINDKKNPPLSYERYYPGNYHAPLKPANIDGTFTLTFEEDTDYYPQQFTTDPIPWDASPYTIASIIKQALNEPVKIMGRGTIGTPWTFNDPDGYRLLSVNSYGLQYAVAELAKEEEPSENASPKEAVEGQSHKEALGTDAYSGKIEIQVNVQVVSGSNTDIGSTEENIGSLNLKVGDSPETVKNKLVKKTHLGEDDVQVKGAGTIKSPWVFTFGGDYKYKEVDFDILNDDYDKIKPEDILTGTLKDARAFDDPDGFMTRRDDGDITLADDSGAHFIYSIDRRGYVSTLVTEWEFVVANGGRVDMEGGLAYDQDGNLFASNHNSFNGDSEKGGNVFKINPYGYISIWVDAEDIADITYGDEDNVKIEGIAFEHGIKNNGAPEYPSHLLPTPPSKP